MRDLLLLMRKDWMSIAVTSRGFLILMAVVWLVFAVLSASALPFIFIMTAYVLIMTLFSMEENDLVCNVVAVLPIRKQDAVIARYLYMYLVLGAEVLLCTTLCPLIGTLLNRTALFSALAPAAGFGEMLTQRLTPTLLSLIACLLMLSITAPLAYKFGYSKMRMLIMIIYIAAFMFAGSIAPFLSALPVGAGISLSGLLIAAGVCILLSLVSLAASLRAVR